MRLYHGTTPEAGLSMLKDGIDLFHPRKADPGDFGRGFYLTNNIHRARACGKYILRVEVDDSQYADIPNPYEPDDSEAGKLFRSLAFDGDNMLTCVHSINREDRQKLCTRIREEFLKRGYKGIKTGWKRAGSIEHEHVVFDLDTIKSMKEK